MNTKAHGPRYLYKYLIQKSPNILSELKKENE